eukprot:PhM_4_TR7966/c0_g1_i1/m.90423
MSRNNNTRNESVMSRKSLPTPAPFKDLESPLRAHREKYVSPLGHLPAFSSGKSPRSKPMAMVTDTRSTSEIGRRGNAAHSVVPASPWGAPEHKGKFQVIVAAVPSPGPAAYTVPRFPPVDPSIALEKERARQRKKDQFEAKHTHAMDKELAAAAASAKKSKTGEGLVPTNPRRTYRGYEFPRPLSVNGFVSTSFGGTSRFQDPPGSRTTPGPGSYPRSSSVNDRIRGTPVLSGNSARTVMKGVVDPRTDVFVAYSASEEMPGVGPASYNTSRGLSDVYSADFTHNVQLKEQAVQRARRLHLLPRT